VHPSPICEQKDKARATRALDKAAELDPKHPDLPALQAKVAALP